MSVVVSVFFISFSLLFYLQFLVTCGTFVIMLQLVTCDKRQVDYFACHLRSLFAATINKCCVNVCSLNYISF